MSKHFFPRGEAQKKNNDTFFQLMIYKAETHMIFIYMNWPFLTMS